MARVSGERFLFGPFTLDSHARRLSKDGEPMALSGRNLELLLLLVSRAGQILSKNELIEAVWRDVAVTDNSLEQAISQLRRLLATDDALPLIQTEARRGYRFAGEVRRETERASDTELEALLEPHRAWLEGRAALETLERDQLERARAVFARVVKDAPHQAPAHVGLANAAVLHFETTRSDAAPDRVALQQALDHAREACRLDRDYAEGWATLGFVLDRTGEHADALAAARRAVSLEPGNWRHRFRLAYISWGDERLREAHRTLALLPGLPIARWLAATVYVARQALPEAERELIAGIEAQEQQPDGPARFSAVGLYWLRGLVALANGDAALASAAFDRELASESKGHLYSRECCANTWYAVGAMHLGRREWEPASRAFREATTRVPQHALAKVGLTIAAGQGAGAVQPFDLSDPLGTAACLVMSGEPERAAMIVDRMIAAAPDGSTGWLLPVEPLLQIGRQSAAWSSVLARLRDRAA